MVSLVIVAAIESAYTTHGSAPANTAAVGESDEHDACEVGEEQDTLTWVAVSEEPCERCKERGGDQPSEEDQPDRLLATEPVCVDRDGDQEGVLPDVGRGLMRARATSGSRCARWRRTRRASP